MESKAANPKQAVPSRHAINWYFGNFLMSPANALRDEDGYGERARKLVDGLYDEHAGQAITHKQFLELMKKKGVHSRFYLYRKLKPTDCPWCRALEIRR